MSTVWGQIKCWLRNLSYYWDKRHILVFIRRQDFLWHWISFRSIPRGSSNLKISFFGLIASLVLIGQSHFLGVSSEHGIADCFSYLCGDRMGNINVFLFAIFVRDLRWGILRKTPFLPWKILIPWTWKASAIVTEAVAFLASAAFELIHVILAFTLVFKYSLTYNLIFFQ